MRGGNWHWQRNTWGACWRPAPVRPKRSSVNGSGYLTDVYALFNSALNGVNACWVAYDKAVTGFYLVNDSYSGLLGPLAVGSNLTLQNTQCTLNGTGSSVSGSGNTLTLVLSL